MIKTNTTPSTIFTVTTYGGQCEMTTHWDTYEAALDHAHDCDDPYVAEKPRIEEVQVFGVRETGRDHTRQSIDTEAREMALTLGNGNRSDVREFIEQHDRPATLALAIVRNLWADNRDDDPLTSLTDAVLNVQALLENGSV